MRVGHKLIFALAVVVIAPDAAWATPDRELLSGARAFQAGRFDEALAAFRSAEKEPGGAGASWYVAATLLKLGRIEDALAAFLDAEVSAPEQRDELLDFYFATAYTEARLFSPAERLLASVLTRAGPKIAERAEKMRAELVPLLAAEPPEASVDWYLARGNRALEARRLRLARVFFEEAAACARRTKGQYRAADAAAGLREAAP